jgi:hypothetical protein
MSKVLRESIHQSIESGTTFRAIERETGVLRQSLMKFARGEQSLRLDLADKLVSYFKIKITR